MNLINKYKEYLKFPENYTVSEVLTEIIVDHTILEKTNIVKIEDCTTCKYQGVSKYVEPCYGCRDHDTYKHYKADQE